MLIKNKILLNKCFKISTFITVLYIVYNLVLNIIENITSGSFTIPQELRGWFLMSIISPIMTGILSTSNWIAWIERHILYSHTLDENLNGSSAIEWINLYLVKNKVYSFDSLSKIITNKNSMWWDDTKTCSSRPQIYEIPSNWIIFKYNNQYLFAYYPTPAVQVSRFDGKEIVSNVTIYSFRKIIWSNFLNDICNYYYENSNKSLKMTVYKNIECYVDDACQDLVDLRDSPSIKMCFGNPEKEKVWNSVIDFFNIETKKHFRKFNQPYKTAYLIHGPTGTGKTELLFQLVSFTWTIYQKPLYIINPTGLNDTQLEKLFANIQSGFVLVDEWDLFLDKENSKNKEDVLPSLNCWLNILDRVQGEIIFWFTTNNFQNLAKFNDGALIRPGRIDHIHKFDKMTPQEVRNALNYFVPDDKDLKSLKDSNLQGLTISQIVNHLKKKLPITTLGHTF
jgi:hypothetical protein